MAFTKITEEDMRGKGNVGRPDTPGVSTAEMQRILDELPREVVVPAFNRLINELGLTTAAGNIGAKNGTVQAHIDSKTNPHGVTAEQVGSYTKQQVGELIDQKIIALGAGDMSKAEFADGPGKVKDSTKLDGKTADQCAVLVYKHSRSGNVHNFTGSGLNGKVKMSENVQPGDTVQLNGAPATAYVGAEDFTDALAGEAIAGKWLTFTREGNALNFKGGGGKVTTTNLTAENIRKGVTVTVKRGARTVENVPGTFDGYKGYAICNKPTAMEIPKSLFDFTQSGGYIIREGGGFRFAFSGEWWVVITAAWRYWGTVKLYKNGIDTGVVFEANKGDETSTGTVIAKLNATELDVFTVGVEGGSPGPERMNLAMVAVV